MGSLPDELLAAAMKGDVDSVKKLLKKGANATPVLYAAVMGGYSDVVKTLLENGADANAVDIHEYDHNWITTTTTHVLYAAARTGNLEMVMALLENGADPNASQTREPDNAYEKSALSVAEANGFSKVAEVLKEAIESRHSSAVAPS
jgi:ankyrin repeat protein